MYHISFFKKIVERHDRSRLRHRRLEVPPHQALDGALQRGEEGRGKGIRATASLQLAGLAGQVGWN